MEQQRLKEEHLKMAAKSKNRDKMMVGKSQSTLPAPTATAEIPPPLNGNTDMNGNDHRMMPSISIGHGYNNDNADDDDDNESSRLDQALFGEVNNVNNHDPLLMTSDRRSGKRDAKDSGSITTISHNDHHNRTIHQSKKLQTSKSGHTEGQSKLNLNHQHQSNHGGMQVPPKNKWRDNNFDDIVNSGFYSMEALRAVGLGFSPTSIRDDERKNDRGIIGAKGSDNDDYRSQPSHNNLTTTTTGLHPYDVFPPPPPPLSASMTDEDYSIAIAHRNERYDNIENNHHHHPHHTQTNSTSSMDHPITPTLDRSLEFQLKEEQLSNNLPLASSTYPIITSSVYDDHSKISNYHPSLYPHHHHRHQQNNHNSIKSGNNTINSITTTHSDNNMRKRRTMMDVISVKIIRASELMDCLGGTNAYIVLDWGKLGKASTQAVINSNEPYFGSTLKFRSPYQRIRRKDINDDDYRDGNILDMLNSRSDHHQDGDDRGDDDECLISHAGPLKVLVYNRNHSVSDELIGIGEIDVHEQLLSLYNKIINNNNNNDNNNDNYNHGSVVSTLYLLDPSGNYKTTRNSVGFIEYTIALH